MSLWWEGNSGTVLPGAQESKVQMTKGEGRDHKNRDTHLFNHTLYSSQSAYINTTWLSHTTTSADRA